MDLATYQLLSGITVASGDIIRTTAQIAKTQAIIESLLGFSLDPSEAAQNQYSEIGKTKDDCPCDTPADLDAPDVVINAYRLFPYNKDDRYFKIDPALSVNAVKLVRNNVTFKTIEDYRAEYKNGYIKFLEQIKCWCSCIDDCSQIQLAVDASWLGAEFDYLENTLPDDLLMIWTDMITYYSDSKNNIKSETLGSHSYTKFGNYPPETLDVNIAILKRYSGPNGLLSKTITI